MRPISKIIVHCSATPRNKDFTAEDIRDWHVKGNGWDDIGYHYVVRLDGLGIYIVSLGIIFKADITLTIFFKIRHIFYFTLLIITLRK